ncbi:BsuPI-related putative proteinase inhibitor [Anaerobacillus isosaccharinicus]|uniref:Intracellular proteinase inhibitor BsuPI domain-containing protein n=1 Tax=Anaerobacillus isosaccharinicus TaxID=1532552 RepID=A0A1S2LLW6_9BACI|nr:BsuPI-related putative proteinase inhibitor [Anaerobacillus isosaccharinicus]MBA5586214.1 hypothetical protein [Anaerobacillus isosaccharinicus]QOY35527.1 hypothetical protein AWH56_023070 [Anaerobacillus isosaccharinicus]
MKKHWKVLSAITLATLITAACGSNDVDQKVGGDNQTGYETPDENDSKEVINEEDVSADLQFSDGYYTFTLKNTSDKNIDFTFSSTQEYEYQIKDQSDNVVYTFSMDKMFGQQVVEKTLASGESEVINVDVNVFSSLQPGTYTLEIWSMALEAENLSSKIEFTLDEVANNLEGTYVGQIDNNSVEIIDEDGNPKAFRLTGFTNEFITSLEAEEKVNYSYYKQNEQLFLTAIHSAQ